MRGIKAIPNAIEKPCSKCRIIKSLRDFGLAKQNSDGRKSRCKLCTNKDSANRRANNLEITRKRERESRKKNADKHRDTMLRRKYRIDGQVAYHEKSMLQGNACAICREPNYCPHVLVVDHDHKCCPTDITCGKCVRDLLCNWCNKIIGYIEKKNYNYGHQLQSEPIINYCERWGIY